MSENNNDRERTRRNHVEECMGRVMAMAGWAAFFLGADAGVAVFVIGMVRIAMVEVRRIRGK